MPIFDDDQDGFWATRFGMTPDDWQAAKTQAADAAGQAYDADTRAMATDDAQPTDGAGADKFQTAYQANLAQAVAPTVADHVSAPRQPKTMTFSGDGLKFMDDRESFSPTVYPDSAGIPTIGWGHRLLPGESYPHGISKDEGDDLRRRDLVNAERAIRQGVTLPLTQNQYDALVSFAYNIGAGGFHGSTVRRKLNEGDYAAAGDHMLDWNKKKVGGKYVVDQGLINRRQDERGFFLKPP